MRRHAMMGLAFVLPLAVTVGAVAQTQGTAAPKTAAPPNASAAPAAASATAAAPAASATVTGATATTTPTTTAPPATTAAAAAAPTSNVDGATYAVRLRDLEARVDELKDQIRRSHTRLSLLSDTIMGGGAAGSRLEIVFQNEMSSAFRLTRRLFVLDGTVQENRSDETGALSDQKESPVFSGSVPPGDHTVQVLLDFQGNGYGVFTYLKGYKFEVKSSHAFTAAEGKTMQLTAIAIEKGGVTTPLEQRPGVEWREKISNMSQPAAPAGGATPGAPAPAAAATVNAGTNSQGAKSVSGGLSVGGGKQ